MKSVILIDFSNVYSFSVRSISAYLKNKGFRISTCHCSGKIFAPLSEIELELLFDHCKKCDIIGISLLSTHYLKRAIQINDYLKDRVKAKIIWGGVPVICDPNSYLTHPDFICTGEGENVIFDLLEEKHYKDIPGLGYRSESGKFIINDVPPLLDLNHIPVPYFDLENTFVLKNNRLASLKEDPKPLLSLSSEKGYRIFPIRGCPYSCTFCSNNRLKKVFRKKGPLIRSMHPSRIIAELEKAIEIIPNLKKIMFYEDDFMMRSEDELGELLQAYSQKIALPININATISNLTEKKLDLISGNGIEVEFIKIGLQSANRRVNKEIFKRHFNREIYLEKLTMLASKGIPVVLDIISDNPYETLADKYESLLFYYDLFKRIKRVSVINNPIKVMDHKLMFYPGTELYNKALYDGIIKDDYIDKVLLTRRTTRNKIRDIDNDTFILALFSWGVKKNNMRMPNIIFEILRIRQIYNFLHSLNIAKYLIIIPYIIRRFAKIILKMVSRSKNTCARSSIG